MNEPVDIDDFPTLLIARAQPAGCLADSQIAELLRRIRAASHREARGSR